MASSAQQAVGDMATKDNRQKETLIWGRKVVVEVGGGWGVGGSEGEVGVGEMDEK